MEIEINLLHTKFFLPKARKNLVHRSRLTAILEEGVKGRLVLISAPAGYGKTSLLADWIHEYQHPIAWLTLDENDNDPTRFIDYFIHSLYDRGFSTLQTALRENEDLFTGNIRQNINILLNCMLSSNQEVIIVLDDYHHIHSNTIHDHLNYMVDHLPPNAHIVLITRADPPLDIPNWRARGFLSEIRRADLCFTLDEAAAFFSTMLVGFDTRKIIHALTSKTEGWIAGMQLAASALSSLHDKKSIEQFVESFKGTNRFILDYLVEEALKNQPEEIKDFLLCTSVLDRFCAPLCDSILDKNDSQEMLEYLERNNLFIIPLDNQRVWYRYHNLFADLLQSQLDKSANEKVRDIHLLASQWFEDNQDFNEAIEHSIQAQDYQHAAQLIQTLGGETLSHGQFTTFMTWVNRLPNNVLYSQPTLCAYYAVALILESNSFQEIQHMIKIIEGNKDAKPYELAIVQALICILQGKQQETAKYFEIIKAHPPEDEFFIGLFDILQSLSFVGTTRDALEHLRSTYHRARVSGNSIIAVTALSYIGDIYKYQGKLQEAWKTYQEALSLSEMGNDDFLSVGSMAFLGLGEIAYKKNQLAEAEEFLKKGMNITSNWEVSHFFGLSTTLARVQIAKGEIREAIESMQQAEDMAIQFDMTEVDDFVVACRITQLKLLMGNLDEVMEWEKHIDTSSVNLSQQVDSFSIIFAPMHDQYALTHAWFLIYQGDYDQAIEILEQLFEHAQENNTDDLTIQYAVLLAVTYEKKNDRSLALRYLRTALNAAQPEGYIRVFLEQGNDILNLLYEAARQDIQAEFTGTLLSLFPQMEVKKESNAFIIHEGDVIEPLSDREVEILDMIAQGLSNQQIAYRLHLSLSTVKVHSYNIYRKLNVHSRVQAVTRAKALKILP